VDRASNDADVSIASPKIPYGGFSPLRLQGRIIRQGLPGGLVCHLSFVLSAFIVRSLLCVRDDVLMSTSVQAAFRSTPGALAPDRVMLSRSIFT
jgi:hypothetical protein